jgi:hypothetical protein
MASDFKASSLDFGVVIAFVAPGFLAFQAVAIYMPSAAALMTAAAEKDQGVGVFLFVVLASLSIGLVVSGVRAITLDNLLRFQHLGSFAVPQLRLNWSRVDDKNLPILLTIRDGHFRHYQFYANTLVAVVVWAIARVAAPGPALHWQHWALIVAVLLALLFSARDSLRRYVIAVNETF